MENGVLVLTDEIALPISVIRDLQSESVSEDDDVVVITQCGSLG